MNRERRPQAELCLRQVQRRPDGGKRKQGNRVEHKDGAQRDGNLFFAGVGDGRDRGDGAAAADRRSRGDEERDSLLDRRAALPSPQPSSMAKVMLPAV